MAGKGEDQEGPPDRISLVAERPRMVNREKSGPEGLELPQNLQEILQILPTAAQKAAQ
jgi:hypothetical protein